MAVLRRTSQYLGEVLLTLGGLVLLFAVWQLWWTDIQANSQSERVLEELRWEFTTSAGAAPDGPGPTSGPGPGEDPESAGDADHPADPDQGAPPPAGTPVAIVHLPAVHEVRPVLEGVDLAILNQGVLGRYAGTADPGEVGNFAVAGHRTTYGRPLWHLGDMAFGDPVVVETEEGYWVYELRRREIVLPYQVEVTAPVPDHPEAEPTEAWMVLTACHPKFSAAERIVGYALLDRFVARDEGPPSELRGEVG